MSIFLSPIIVYFTLIIINDASGTLYNIRVYKVTVGSAWEDKYTTSLHWSTHENALYWVGRSSQTLHRMDEDTREITTRHVCFGPTGLIIPIKNCPGYLLVAVGAGFYLMKWGTPEEKPVYRLVTMLDLGKPDNTIADNAAVDLEGRLVFGTTGPVTLNTLSIVIPDQGTLYLMDAKNFACPEIKKRPVSMPSGAVWSTNHGKMYHIDCPKRKIVSFDYNILTGRMGNETEVFDFGKYDIAGYPCGMTKDVNDNLWVVTNTGREVIQFNPHTGKILMKIKLPVERVTSITFGGRNMDKLYLGSGCHGVTNPINMSGAVLMVTGHGTRGVPDYPFVFPNADKY